MYFQAAVSVLGQIAGRLSSPTRILAAVVKWPQDLLVDFNREGLLPDVKTMLIAAEAAGTAYIRLDQIVAVASRLDSQLSPLRKQQHHTS